MLRRAGHGFARMIARRPLGGAILALLALGLSARAEGYKVAVGDTLVLNIAGLGLERKMVVGLDGTISVPIMGEIKAEGATVAELLEQMRASLPSKTYTMRTPDGRDAPTVIAADEIGLAVSDYRPVYVNGDVAKPGEQPYRPGMTARQAVAIAGGYDIVRFRIENPAFTTYDLLSEYRTSWLDRTRASVRAGWLAKALGQAAEPDPPTVGRDLLSEAAKAEVLRTETALLEAKAANFRSAREGSQRTVAGARTYVAALEAQLKTEEGNAKFDAEETDRITDLFRRGTVPATRVAEIRRLSLLTATRVVQVAAQLESARRALIDAERELNKIENERRSDLLSSAQEAAAELRRLGPRIDAVWEKLRYVTALRSQLVEGGSGGERLLSVVRRTGGTSRTMPAGEDEPLQPGDVVEVRLRVDYAAGIDPKAP